MFWIRFGAFSKIEFNSSPRSTPEPNACDNCNIALDASVVVAPAIVICFCTKLAKATTSSEPLKASFALLPNLATTAAVSVKEPLASCAEAYIFLNKSSTLPVSLKLSKSKFNLACVCVTSSDKPKTCPAPFILKYAAVIPLSLLRSPFVALVPFAIS
ncbi:unknown [Eubacterium sp. CAG:274]|nr:unknown [Eubacterium sp. CAG:274]